MMTIKFLLSIALGVFLLNLTNYSGGDDANDPKVANSPTEIHPLLIGSKVPTITGLTKTDGTPFNLSAAVVQQPSILIFYRGGW